MKPRDYTFPIIMCLITLVTVYRYGAIKQFLQNSQEYTFVVKADENSVGKMKSELEVATFQEVTQEKMDEETYKLTIKCPPDKIGRISMMLMRIADRKEAE